jgi:hypothetical protein
MLTSRDLVSIAVLNIRLACTFSGDRVLQRRCIPRSPSTVGSSDNHVNENPRSHWLVLGKTSISHPLIRFEPRLVAQARRHLGATGVPPTVRDIEGLIVARFAKEQGSRPRLRRSA